MNFILKFTILILTEKLQPHHFTVTETLNSNEYMMSLPPWVKRRHIVQNLKICRRKNSYSMYVQLLSSRSVE